MQRKWKSNARNYMEETSEWDYFSRLIFKRCQKKAKKKYFISFKSGKIGAENRLVFVHLSVRIYYMNLIDRVLHNLLHRSSKQALP